MSAQCTDMAFSTSSYTTYMLVCPFDTTSTINNTEIRLTVTKWTYPSTFGVDAMLGKVVSMAWSNNDAAFVGFINDFETGANNLYSPSCNLSQV